MTEVLDAVDFGVIRIASDGQVAVTNEAHGRLQQAIRSDEDDRATDVPAFRDDGVTRLPHDELPLERALRGEAFDGQVVWFGSEPGPRQALSITARRLTDSSGEDAGAVVVSRDVTTELNALRARDELVASVSHELRTPLTSILGYLDLAIEDPDLPEHLRSNLDIAERNAERLLGIIADILAASSSSVVGRGIPRAGVDRCARDRARRPPRPSRPARRRARHRDRHERARGGVRLGGSAAGTPGRRQPALQRDHVQPRRRNGLPGTRPATAPPAGSSCATRAWA